MEKFDGIPTPVRKKLANAAAVLLILGSVLINIKNIVTSCQVDAEYQVAMAYRMLRGDAMFSKMWEAHQTSAFFLAIFEWIFLKITGSTTGIMLYANAVGVACKTVVAFCVYCVIRKYADKRAAFMALLFALNAYPKDIVLPDFANLQIWFGLLLMCCMIRYLASMETMKQGNGVTANAAKAQEESEKKPGATADRKRSLPWLILGALCLCLQVLSYPSCANLWLGCVILMWRYSDRRLRDIGIFTGVCALCGGVYLLYFMRGDPAKFMEYVFYIWSGDETHAIGMAERLGAFGQDLVLLLSDLRYILIVAVCAAFASWVCKKYFGKGSGKETEKEDVRAKRLYPYFCWFLVFYILGYLLHLPKEDVGTKYHFFLLYGFVEIAAWIGRKYLKHAEKRVFDVGQAVGIGGFLATLFLSDMGLFAAFSYLIPAICVSMLSLVRWGDVKIQGSGATAGRGLILAFSLCAVLIFRNFIYLNGWMEAPKSFREDSIFGTTWTAEYGPLKGIRNGDGAYVADITWREWQDMIKPGDRVVVLSYPTLPAAIYLDQDVEICIDSVISTPTYSERLLAYWRENPEKYPNVVVVKCYGGSPMIGEYNVITKWIDEEFHAVRVEDGTYWRYYFADEKNGIDR